MDLDPNSSRTNALLYELCVTYGWCDIRHQAAAFHSLVASGAEADALVDAILTAEGAELNHPHRAKYLLHVVEDWLFDPHGKGARSGMRLI